MKAASMITYLLFPVFIQPVLCNLTAKDKLSYLCALMETKRTVAFHTLGCKLNFSETSTLARMLEQDGFEKRAFDDLADVYVINTCSVTENADKECRHLVRRIQRKAPQSLVVITGCYAQLKPKEIADIPGVDLVLGAAEKFNIGHHLKELDQGQLRPDLQLRYRRSERVQCILLTQRPHAHFHESTGRLRLQLFLLHHSHGPWQEP